MALTRAQIHARWRAKMQASLPQIPCECGCGEMIPSINKVGQPARFVRGHRARLGGGGRFNKGQIPWNRVAGFTQAARQARHRQKKHATWDALPKIRCTCGCGERINPIGRLGQPVRYKRGHNSNSGKLQRNEWSNLTYDGAFTTGLRRFILKRDDYTCQDCGTGVGRRKGHRKVNIHHVDFNKRNSVPSNLVALCIPCHIRRHHRAKSRAG